jgi:hypothetical protein
MRRSLSVFLLLLLSELSVAQTTTVEVCVYGGTSAGVIAAYTARKAGKSVVLIEPGRHLGGMSAGGLGNTDIGNKRAIRGLARDFYRRVGRHYGKPEQWTFEPHVAEAIFEQYIREAAVPVLRGYRADLFEYDPATLQISRMSVKPTPDAVGSDTATRQIVARQFIDCSYEGDLMMGAPVSYTIGREPNAVYGETWNGVQLLDKHQFPDNVDPYRVPGKPESGLLWGIGPDRLQPTGSGDRHVQAYNFRLCLTDDPANRVAISRPAGYDSTKYELLLRQIEKKTPPELTWQLMHIVPMPNRKTDINNCGGFSTDMIGAADDYAEASYERRADIIRQHEQYTKGLLWFIGHDARMPPHLRREMLRWGYPKDEYPDNDHFSPQLYVREARRLVGEYVMTQANCEGRSTVADSIGLAAYTMDSHNCQRVVVRKNGVAMVKNEGDVQVGGFGPYPISYRALVPKRGQCRNLLVPVCLSASHIAYGSIRMEPVFMGLGQAAALAACQAIDRAVAVQDVDVTRFQDQLFNK